MKDHSPNAFPQQVFSLDFPKAFPNYYSPAQAQSRSSTLERMAEQIATLCSCLGEYPAVRYVLFSSSWIMFDILFGYELSFLLLCHHFMWWNLVCHVYNVVNNHINVLFIFEERKETSFYIFSYFLLHVKNVLRFVFNLSCYVIIAYLNYACVHL